jgi:diacylglycerol kinase (ATP)
MKKYFFIINANNSKAVKHFVRLKNEMDKENIPYRTFYTEHPGHAVEIAKKITYINEDSIRAIIAVGGDGTIHEVYNGIKEHGDIPIGFISGGSGNDIVRVLTSKIKGVKKQVSYLKRFRTDKIDAGILNLIGRSSQNHGFISAIGIGLDGEVAKQVNGAPYKKWLHRIRLGTLAYVLALFKVLKGYRTTSVVVHIDGQKHSFENVWLVAVGNMPYYGGGMKICPEARHNDGFLDICVVNNMTVTRLLLLFISVFWGGHVKAEGVSQYKAKRITIETERPLAIQADGEYKGTTPVDIHIEERAVSVKI